MHQPGVFCRLCFTGQKLLLLWRFVPPSLWLIAEVGLTYALPALESFQFPVVCCVGLHVVVVAASPDPIWLLPLLLRAVLLITSPPLYSCIHPPSVFSLALLQVVHGCAQAKNSTHLLPLAILSDPPVLVYSRTCLCACFAFTPSKRGGCCSGRTPLWTAVVCTEVGVEAGQQQACFSNTVLSG